jgi:hypothetical protein
VAHPIEALQRPLGAVGRRLVRRARLDQLGRDVFSRVIVATQLDFFIAVSSVGLVLLSVSVGAGSGGAFLESRTIVMLGFGRRLPSAGVRLRPICRPLGGGQEAREAHRLAVASGEE